MQTLEQTFNIHNSHQVDIVVRPLTKKGQPTHHAGQLRCVDCNKHIKWLSIKELMALDAIDSEDSDTIESELITRRESSYERISIFQA